MRYADTFLLVVEPTRQSVLSASRLLSLRENARVVLVANKVAGADDIGYIETHLDEPVWAALPSDPAILAADRAGHALVDHAPGSPVIGVMEQLADQLEDVTSDQVLRQGHAP